MTAESVQPETSATYAVRTPRNGVGRPLTTQQEIATAMAVADFMAERLVFSYRAWAHHEVMRYADGPDGEVLHKFAYFLRHGPAWIDTEGMDLVYQVTSSFFRMVGDDLLDESPDHPHSWATPGRVQDHAYARVTFEVARRHSSAFALLLLGEVADLELDLPTYSLFSHEVPDGWFDYVTRTVRPLGDYFGVGGPKWILRRADWRMDAEGLVLPLVTRDSVGFPRKQEW